MSAEPEARCPTCGGIALEKAPKSWKNSRWRQIMLIVIAIDVPPFIYGCIQMANFPYRSLSEHYFSPVLWITGAVFIGHCLLFVGAFLLLMNSDSATEGIKIGAGLVFVFQCLAVALAMAAFVGWLFNPIDPQTGQPIALSGRIVKEFAVDTFLTPRMFATTWLTISQMVILMVAVEKEKKEL
jgi:hypothetical protein